MANRSRRQVLGALGGAAATAALSRPALAQTARGPLSVWKFGGTPREVEFWPQQNQLFQRARPNIQLNYSYLFGQIRRQRIIAGFQTRRLADVVVAFGQDIPEFVGFNIIQPLDALNRRMVDAWRGRIVPEIWNTGMHEGKVYGLPTYVDMASFLAYNVQAFEEAGLTRPPQNWDELRDYARRLTRPGRPGIAVPVTTAPVDVNIFEGIAYANGGRIYDERTNRVTFTDPGVVDTLKLYRQLVEDGSTPPPASLVETNFRDLAQLFGQGRVAMWAGMSWLNTPWPVEGNIRWAGALFPRPARPTGASPPVSTLLDPTAILMVSAQSRNAAAAMDYLDFWSQDARLDLWNGEPEYSRVPAGRHAWSGPRLQQHWPDWVARYRAGTLFQGAQSLPRFLGVSQVESRLATAMQEAVLGRKPVEQALTEQQTAAQQQIDIIRG